MAPQKGVQVAGAYFDFKEYVKDGPELIITRTLEYLPPEPNDFGYFNVPVRADVLFCSGPHKGKVLRSERIVHAPTAFLRGVPNPTKEKPAVLEPRWPVGTELYVRVQLPAVNTGRTTYVQFNVTSDAEDRQCDEVYAGGKGWDGPLLVSAPATIADGGEPPF